MYYVNTRLLLTLDTSQELQPKYVLCNIRKRVVMPKEEIMVGEKNQKFGLEKPPGELCRHQTRDLTGIDLFRPPL